MRTHVPYLLAVASTVVTRRVDERLYGHDLTVRQYGLLAQLSAEPELAMAELARQLGIARQPVHQLVNELVAGGGMCADVQAPTTGHAGWRSPTPPAIC
ncbi:MarR family winged helix-turn-helix transcriptional regulator [Streptomyces sp. NPDC058335]|uniref:MarR family winged helix-turn-helix transcriptional regulator n=1 Tax=Streptomyces sp. NPDC058335 TaxID=3346451 RepID=UPI0036509013